MRRVAVLALAVFSLPLAAAASTADGGSGTTGKPKAVVSKPAASPQVWLVGVPAPIMPMMQMRPIKEKALPVQPVTIQAPGQLPRS